MGDLGKQYRKNFRENLKSFRLKKGFTQSELALKANYNSTYVGKLERGASEPSFETIIRISNVLEVDPLKLLRPSRAHLDIRNEIPEEELADLPYNPLDIQIFDSLPFAMGIVTNNGTPVYLNNAFVKHTGIECSAVEELKFWELSCWKFGEASSQEIIEVIERVCPEDDYIRFHLETTAPDEAAVNLFFYPTPVQYKPEDEMMWIFEFRHSDHRTVNFPLEVSAVRKIEQ